MAVVRPARLDDLGHLAAVQRFAGRRYDLFFDRTEPFDGDTLAHELLVSMREKGLLWVAERDHGIAGFLAALLRDDLLHVEELSVALDHQQQGLGDALLRTAVQAARDLSLGGVSLTTGKKYPWTYPFYAKRGFAERALADCPPGLTDILTRNKAVSHDADTRIAMVRLFG